jgi:hypothetical protein
MNPVLLNGSADGETLHRNTKSPARQLCQIGASCLAHPKNRPRGTNGIPAFNAGVAPLTLTTPAGVGGFVTSLYQTVLGRAPDSAGLNFWLQQLHARATHTQLANAFWISAEHRGLEVDQFYTTLLHRAADAAGRQAWVNALLAGASENDVVVDFLTSGEYTASHPDVASYVTGLYADLLSRSPDAAGFAFWSQILQTGSRSRGAVAYYFLTSTES